MTSFTYLLISCVLDVSHSLVVVIHCNIDTVFDCITSSAIPGCYKFELFIFFCFN